MTLNTYECVSILVTIIKCIAKGVLINSAASCYLTLKLLYSENVSTKRQ